MKPNLLHFSEGQRILWPELEATPEEFTLFGGNAIAIRFGHRSTADFDFFCRSAFDPENLYKRTPYLMGSEILQIGPNTLVCSVMRGEPVKVSFFGLPDFGTVGTPEIVEGPGIKVSPVLELAGTKTSVIQKRAASRDYLDLDLLIAHGGVELRDALLAGRKLYGPIFNPHIALKALSFFQDGDLPSLPSEVRERLTKAAAQIDLNQLAHQMKSLT